MKKIPAHGYLLFLAIAILLSQVFTREVSIAKVTQNFAPTVCPAPASGGTLTAALPSKKVQVHDVIASKKALVFKSAGASSRTVTKSPLLIVGNSGTSFAIQTKSGNWTGGVTCTAGIADSWFVGGSADLTGQSILSLVNSGLSDAIIDVIAYTEKGKTAQVSYTVKQSSQKDVRLDSIVPGSSSVTLHLVTRTGRVTSYLFDERKKGLRTYGGDYVNAQNYAATDLFIGGVPTYAGKNFTAKHMIRLMNASDVSTSASVQVANSKSVFVPFGLNAISLEPGKVRDVVLDGDLGKDILGIKISADQKIVASVYTYFESKSSRDFLWSTPSQSRDALALGPISFNIGGLEPVLTFASDNIDVAIRFTSTNGKTSTKTIRASDVAYWKVPPNTRAIVIERLGRGAPLSSGGLTWQSAAGFGYLPLKSGALLEVSTRPISNAATIS